MKEAPECFTETVWFQKVRNVPVRFDGHKNTCMPVRRRRIALPREVEHVPLEEGEVRSGRYVVRCSALTACASRGLLHQRQQPRPVFSDPPSGSGATARQRLLRRRDAAAVAILVNEVHHA